MGECVSVGASAASGSVALARPKSSTFTVPSSRTLMFAGFRSRCTMPRSCAASSASAICFAIVSVLLPAGRDTDRANCRRPSTARRRASHRDQLHHDDWRIGTVEAFQSVDLRDVRVIQLREELGLAPETCEAFGVSSEGRWQDLNRDLTLQPRMVARYTSPMPPAPIEATIS